MKKDSISKMTPIYRTVIVCFFTYLLASCASNPSDELAPFTSDGCSSFPDGTLKQQELWLDCCVEHDKAYWLGGDYADRLQADKDLEACVGKVGEKRLPN